MIPDKRWTRLRIGVAPCDHDFTHGVFDSKSRSHRINIVFIFKMSYFFGVDSCFLFGLTITEERRITVFFPCGDTERQLGDISMTPIKFDKTVGLPKINQAPVFGV